MSTKTRPTRHRALRAGAVTTLIAGAVTAACLAAPTAAIAVPDPAPVHAPISWVTYDDPWIVDGGRAVDVLVTAVCAPGGRIAPRTFGITVTQGEGHGMVGGTAFRPITCNGEPQTSLMRVTAMDGRTFMPGPALGDGWVSRDDDELPGEGRLVREVVIE